MTNSEWAGWANHHKTIFAMRTEDDAEMIAAWRSMLGHVSFVDLKEASDQLLATGGTYKSEHVAALLRLVAGKTRARAIAWESQDDRFVCEVCRDRGLVDVPHPSCIANGELIEGNFGGVHYLATVVCYCKCNKGARKHQWQLDKLTEKKAPQPFKMPCSLEWYERNVCCHWRALMEEIAFERANKQKVYAEQYKSRRKQQAKGTLSAPVQQVIGRIGVEK